MTSFDGDTIDAVIDEPRLQSALSKVYRLMLDGQWRTLAQIAAHCGTSEAGASARLRDLRKPRFAYDFPNGGVGSRRVTGGLWEYCLSPVPKVRPGMLFDISKPAERS